MVRIAGNSKPHRKWSSLTTAAFIQMFVCLFASSHNHLVNHINGSLHYNVCSRDACPMFRMNLRDFKKNWVLEDYRFRYNFTINSILWELDTVRVNCIKTHGKFNCTLPSNDCAHVIYGTVQAKGMCTRSSYSRENGDPPNGTLKPSLTKWGDFTTMNMQLKMTDEGHVPAFSVRCDAPGFNDSVTIVALVYRCTRAVDVLDI